VVSNQRLQNIFGDLPARQAFKMADNIVATAVKGVAEIITVHGNVNIDYTDVHTVMHNSKVFIMGTGFAVGEGRAMEAVNQALESPLLDSNDIYGTKNILLNIISGKEEIRIGEIGEIIETLQEKAGQEADIIWGNGYDESLGDKISVTILATGFVTNPNQILQPKKETEKFGLEEEPKHVKFDKAEIEANFVSEESDEDNIIFDYEDEDEMEEEVVVQPKKVVVEKPLFSRKKKKEQKKKVKTDEPVTEPSIDNWFYKNFGLGRLFEDDDQSMDE
jgi:cell division protein FtsZ